MPKPVYRPTDADIRAHIDRARKLLQPTPVRSGHVPSWLSKALRRHIKSDLFTYSPTTHCRLQYAVCSKCPYARWLDHWGSTTMFGDPIFVAEPYLNEDDLPNIAAFADRLDIAWSLSPNSWHFPGRTTRILFYPKGPNGDEKSRLNDEHASRIGRELNDA